MKTLAKGILTAFIVTISTIFVFGQKGVEDGSRFGHGEDSITCVRNLSLYRSNVKNRDYGEITLNSWSIVYTECPKASKYIYIDGIKMIEKEIKKTTDPIQKATLVDSMMHIYDQRIQNYNEKGKVLGYKGVDFIKYSVNSVENMQAGYGYLKESVKLQKYKSKAAELLTFMQASKALFSANSIEGGQVVEDYGMISEICDYVINNQKKGYKNIEKAKPSIDQVFETSGAATCEDLVPFYTTKFKETPEDLEFLKKSTKMLRATKCIDSDIFFTMAEKLITLEPTAQLAYELAKITNLLERYDVASKYYLQAIELETEDVKKSKYYYELSHATRALENKSLARSYALKSIQFDPTNGHPYILIGTLYASSNKECGENEIEQKSVYWAAVDKFEKAKAIDPELTEQANGFIASYKPRFPKNENIFMYLGKDKLGTTYKVGCWINETTIIRASDK
jgi:tetratricopeptide (TPR) repeat protein